MSTLSATTNSSEVGLPWWGILLIVIGCILVALAGVVGYNFWYKKNRGDVTKQLNQAARNRGMEELQQAKKNLIEVGDDV
jgi:uncharacterized iron-regulated membrane protein